MAMKYRCFLKKRSLLHLRATSINQWLLVAGSPKLRHRAA